jgi:hypothetical protein
MTSTDMGQNWIEHPTSRQALIEPRACMGSLINVGRELLWRKQNQLASSARLSNKKANEALTTNNFLLFSNPDSTNGRNHITIKASLDGGLTWPAQHHLLLDEQTGSGYSCLTMIDEETVGILYESSQAHLAFQRIKLDEILQPPADQKTKNPKLMLRQFDRESSSPTRNHPGLDQVPRSSASIFWPRRPVALFQTQPNLCGSPGFPVSF